MRWQVIGGEELHNLHFSPNDIRVIKSRSLKWARHVASMGQRIDAHKFVVGRPEGKSQLRRHGSRWG
jgi:hypothetical protein